MSEITWIKLNVGMFDNRKIKQIRKLPGGNDIILFWVMLLTLAGRSNTQGYILLTDAISYTPEMLSVEFDMSLDTVKLALEVFKRYNMVEIHEQAIKVKNWEEYQSVEGMEKIKEQTRRRVAKFRENQKLNSDCNVTSNVTVTQCNAIDKERDIDKDIDIRDKERVKRKDDSLPPQAIELCTYYETLKTGESIVSHIDTLKIMIDIYSFDWCKEALQKTVLNKGKFIKAYMEKILQNWQKDGKEEPNARGTDKPDIAGSKVEYDWDQFKH